MEQQPAEKTTTERQVYGAFILDENFTYLWECRGEFPDGQGGFMPAAIVAEFRYVDSKRRRELQRKNQSAFRRYSDLMKAAAEARVAGDDDRANALFDEADGIMAGMDDAHSNLLREVLVGWKEGITDGKGEPVPFSEDNRERLLRLEWARLTLARGFNESLESKDPAKN